jgi:hypothetical protein
MVANKHYADVIGLDFVKDVIRKAFQVRASKALVGLRKRQWIPGDSICYRTKFPVRLVRELRRSLTVISENLLHVMPDQRVMISAMDMAKC